MNKKLLIIALAIGIAASLTGCGWVNRTFTANVTGYSRSCVDGVEYLQFPSGVTVAYNADGTIKRCN